VAPIQKLIEQYCAGDSSAGEELLLRFSPYILKFRQLLYAGVFNPTDSEIVRFLRLFGRSDVSNTAEWLSRKLRASYELEDIEQDLRLCLLLCVKKYRKIRGYYIYVLYKHIVRTLIRDPLVRGNVQTLSGDSEAISEYVQTEEVFESWMKDLSEADQVLFRSIYREGLNVVAAAKKVGYTRGQARVRLHRIRMMLRDKISMDFETDDID
jgi:DNA-directed RNA polymerase specialized sigma24 family protein